jgi:hypothetical protein
MLIRYLHLAMLAATAFSRSTPESVSSDMDRQLADFNWDIAPEDGYPIIGFSNSTEEGEVVFKYNFTGTLSDQKYLDVKLYQNDCVSAADQSLAFKNSTTGDELDVDVDIIQETIRKSVHYQDLNGTAAIIGFCLRVDYNYVNFDGNTEVVMFYETNVTINVDLTSNFTLTELVVDKRLASGDAVEAELDYGVEAYICLEDGSEVMEPPELGRGSALLFCVRTDANATTDILVADILSMTISQPGGTASGTSSIVNGVSDPLTDKVCEEGICSLKTQLSSKFFARVVPDTIATESEGVSSGGGGGGGGYVEGQIVEDSPIEGGVAVGGGNMVASGGDPGNGCVNPEELYTNPDGEGQYTGNNKIMIEIHYDDYPSESGWTIRQSGGDYITGLCTGFFSTQDVIVANTVYVAAGAYIFEMTDNYGDGLCCGYGEGGFNIYVNDVIVENDITFDFTYSVQLNFDVVDISAGRARRLDDPMRRLEDEIPVLEVDGVALLAFGRRRLRAPIRGLLTGDGAKAFMAAQQHQYNGKEAVVGASTHRMLQDGAAESGFGLQINLKDELASDSDSQGSGSGSQMAVAVLVLIVLTGGCGLGFFFCTRRARNKDKEEDIVKHHSSAASVDTYASQCSVNSSSEYEYPSNRERGRIT